MFLKSQSTQSECQLYAWCWLTVLSLFVNYWSHTCDIIKCSLPAELLPRHLRQNNMRFCMQTGSQCNGIRWINSVAKNEMSWINSTDLGRFVVINMQTSAGRPCVTVSVRGMPRGRQRRRESPGGVPLFLKCKQVEVTVGLILFLFFLKSSYWWIFNCLGHSSNGSIASIQMQWFNVTKLICTFYSPNFIWQFSYE